MDLLFEVLSNSRMDKHGALNLLIPEETAGLPQGLLLVLDADIQEGIYVPGYYNRNMPFHRASGT